jgi:hypothetical protein
MEGLRHVGPLLITHLLASVTVGSTALLIGNEIAVWVFINPVLWKAGGLIAKSTHGA